jgi:hypothetical protein
MALEDLAAHDSQFVEPISIDYEDITVWECPPNGQGIAALIALGVLKELQKQKIVDFSKLEHNSAEYLHTVIEALRIAFADARHYVADPDCVSVPTKELLDEEYLRERAKLFIPNKANPEVKKGYPTHNSGTVYFSVVDDYGNACSFIVRFFVMIDCISFECQNANMFLQFGQNSNYMGFGVSICLYSIFWQHEKVFITNYINAECSHSKGMRFYPTKSGM